MAFKPKSYAIREADFTAADQARFWSNCRIDIRTGCIHYEGQQSDAGYGRFMVMGRRIVASRVAYALAYGMVPADLYVCHHCDTPSCVRPDHLFLGTPDDNAKDRDKKGRQSRGEAHRSAKLTEARVVAILADTRPVEAIAAAHGVSKATVQHILNGRRWSHIPRNPGKS